MNDTYTLTFPHLTLGALPFNVPFVGDYSAEQKPAIDARVRSGDYFIMLATTLDTIAAELSEISPAATSMALAKLAEELDYIQKHYAITKKSHTDRLTSLY